MRTVYPLVRYRDAGKAVEWLVQAFGFEVHELHTTADGGVGHGELIAGTGMIMTSPGEPGGPGVYVAVDDPDAHHARAVAAGAEVTMEPADKDYGSRDYACKDLEGNIWYFGTYRP
ncbi:VOC family protein [Streptosporangium sp. NPDC000563]|uniref:VOC family protein n=1 Tax=Streptosporangium sp. NPDC000563 TaxID=3154366 RepID=UPI00332EB79E